MLIDSRFHYRTACAHPLSQGPELHLDMSGQLESLLLADVSSLLRNELNLDVPRLQKPVLLLDLSTLQRPLLHLDVSSVYTAESCAALVYSTEA
jgi:hypothetical protein